ncbi:MAG TPA: hypothetical protein VEH86_05260 [Candidatus Acidoferrum sp.]|nr:hypothetical protein [Candidatus Acidoferrum sp.]
MSQEDTQTQGKTTNKSSSTVKKQQNKTKILSPKTGALSVTPAKAPTATALAEQPIRAELPALSFRIV